MLLSAILLKMYGPPSTEAFLFSGLAIGAKIMRSRGCLPNSMFYERFISHC